MTSLVPDDVVALIAAAVSRCPEQVRDAVHQQVFGATMLSVRTGTRLDLDPVDAAPVPAPDGPLRPIPEVVDGHGRSTGELLVWVDGGRVVGLEQPWWSDAPPSRWPTPDMLRF